VLVFYALARYGGPVGSVRPEASVAQGP